MNNQFSQIRKVNKEKQRLIKEWHPTKNGSLIPFVVKNKYKTKIWWLCPKGHEWQATIYKRTIGHGCPYCSGHRVSKENSLATKNPKLVKEWHLTKNGNLTPEKVTSGSGRKVWWSCSNGHEWQAVIHTRNKGIGCPYCSGKKINKENCLSTVNPKLLKEWHNTKNKDINPHLISPNSHHKAWWICSKGHEWEAQIKGRNNGGGCPYCSGHKVCKDNCLATIYPDLAKEWHPTKNGKLTPDDVTYGSGINVWWKCKNGHEWKQQINQRKKNGKIIQCPYCTGERLFHENCLATVNPELAKEWHPARNGKLTPSDIFPNSNKKVWWRCKKGHEWNAVVASRNAGGNCPYCAGQKVCKDNCLATVNPELAREWHPTKNCDLTPSDITPGSTRKKVWWKCKRDHEWQSTVANRVNGTRCPVCNPSSSQLELRIYAEIKKIFKDAKHRIKLFGEEVDIYIPSLKIGIEVDGYHWHKNKSDYDLNKNKKLGEHDIKIIRIREKGLLKIVEQDIILTKRAISIEDIKKSLKFLMTNTSNLSIIKSCRMYLKSDNFINDKYYRELLYRLPSPPLEKSLSLINPELAKEWNLTKNGVLTPDDVYTGSEIKVWWRCKKGHEWEATVYSRNAGNGCPYCAGQKVSNENCLANKNPLLAKEWHPLKNIDSTPYNVIAGSNKKAWWLCSKGHEWEATIGSRNAGNGCPYCSGKKVCKDNCLKMISPKLAKEWHPNKNNGLEPSDVTYGSKKKVWWLCSKGHEWDAVVCDRYSGNGCPYCSGKRVCHDNCLETKNPQLAKEWHPDKNNGLTPKNLTSDSNKKVWWKCKNGHEWEAVISSRNRGRGCPYCAGQKVSMERCLATINPQIADEWHPTKNIDKTPEAVMSCSNKKAWWKCSKGHEWEATISSRVRGRGCPYCARKK